MVFSFVSAVAVLHSTISTACFPLSILCSYTMLRLLWKLSVWTAVGFLHRDRPGRPSLALDLMEEFRPVLADRVVLSLINRQQVKAEGFRTTETGAVLMDDRTRKEVILAYQTRKQEEILHPFLDERVEFGLLLHIQALLFARFLRGDLDAYPPFLWK